MNGLLAALDYGICDELSAEPPFDEPTRKKLRGSDARRSRKRTELERRLSLRRNPLAEPAAE